MDQREKQLLIDSLRTLTDEGMQDVLESNSKWADYYSQRIGVIREEIARRKRESRLTLEDIKPGAKLVTWDGRPRTIVQLTIAFQKHYAAVDEQFQACSGVLTAADFLKMSNSTNPDREPPLYRKAPG